MSAYLVYLGVAAGLKNRILMYYHLIIQCCSVFLNSLYVILMYYGFVFMAFSEPHFVQPASMFLTLTQIFMTFWSLKKRILPKTSLCGFCRSLGSENVNYEKSLLTVEVLIFGRTTAVELEFSQVEKT